MNPVDHSGTVSLSVRWDVSRAVSLTVIAYAPWGARSMDGILRSEYGGSPYSVFAQLGVYF